MSFTGRIGLLAPSSNTTVEPEFYRALPDGVTLHTARLPITQVTPESIGKMADPAAFDVARQIGLDGVQVSLGTAKNNMHLRQPAIQQAYRDAAKKNGVRVASLAIGELNEIPYKSDPRTIEWVADSIDACKALDCRVVDRANSPDEDIAIQVQLVTGGCEV